MADRTITDDAGRSVTVPGVGALNKNVYYTSSTGEIYSFTLAPDLEGGRTMDYTQDQLQYLPQGVEDLPYLGTVSGGKQLNPEARVNAGIKLIVDVTAEAIQDTDISQADDLQNQTGIPVVIYDGEFNNIPQTYRELGSLLGREDQADTLASYVESTLAAVDAAVAQVPDDQKVSLYYAEGTSGLSTEPDQSMHALAFLRAGASNVASDVSLTGGKGMTPVSLEQVIQWNPSVIVTTSTDNGGPGDSIASDPSWASISAVQNGRVYVMPSDPFSWCDRPPAVNRVLGVQWLANVLYPQQYSVDMVQQTETFYQMFYHVSISDDQAKALLGNSYNG
jgi:iron complex transport system substrate-binding protein